MFHINRLKLPDQPDEAADFWLSRQALGLMSRHDLIAFRKWLDEPVNAAAFARAEKTFEEMSSLAAHPEVVAMRADLLPAGQPKSPHLTYRTIAAATVAVFILSGIGLLHLNDQSPNVAAVTFAASGTKRYETAVGERQTIRLDDGSIVDLNTNSVMEVAFNRDTRVVRLIRGEALFKVAHNNAWPFVVTAKDREVTAVGTAFVVRLDGDAVKVIMVEGKVSIAPLNKRGFAAIMPGLVSEPLVAGEELTASAGNSEMSVSNADVEKSTSWRSGEIIFRDDTLQTAVEEFNRYTDEKIVISDPKVSTLRISGVFHTDRPSNFLAAVTSFYPLKARKVSKGVTELDWKSDE